MLISVIELSTVFLCYAVNKEVNQNTYDGILVNDLILEVVKVKKWRLFSLVMAIVMCLAMLSACSGKSSTDQAPIKVGILAPLTGGVAQYGINVRNGARLYLEQINAAGGVNGKQIEILEYDEEGEPEKAVTGYNSLLDQGVTAIIGDVTTAPTLAVVPEAYGDNMPLITASATAAAVTYDEETDTLYNNVFRSCFIDPFQGEKMASFAVEKLGAKTAAILFNTGSDYSIGLKDSFEMKAAQLGLEVVATEGYAEGAVDFQGQLTNIASKNPDILFVPYYYETVALIAQQAQSAGVKATMIGVDGWDAIMGVVTDPSLLEGSYYCSGYSPDDTTPAVQQFLADYRERYNEEPNMFAAQGYDAAMILVAAIEQAEAANLKAGSAEYKQKIIDAMKATDMECVTGHVTYNEYNNPEKTAVIINITGGEAKFWGKY